jgi:hypothetical protein
LRPAAREHPYLGDREELSGFEKRLKELADQYSDDPRKALDVLLQEMLARRLERKKKTQVRNE